MAHKLTNVERSQTESVGNGRGTFCTSCIRTDDDGLLVVRNVEHDVSLQKPLGI